MTGFFGKLPCRGDFLRQGLPHSFLTPWDRWVSGTVAASRDRLGEAWLPAWLEAPVWRFVLPAGQCGPDGVLGVWMPSVDSAGRYFPLTIAAIFRGRDAARVEAWLDAAEDSGRTALETDTDPAQLAARLATLPAPAGETAPSQATWWTDGAPQVAAVSLDMEALPTASQFTAMLGGPE
jgi:type VI secretion system protein ImpM